MKNYLMLPLALIVAVSMAACSSTTDAPQADFAAPPPPAIDPGAPSAVSSEPLPPLEPGL